MALPMHDPDPEDPEARGPDGTAAPPGATGAQAVQRALSLLSLVGRGGSAGLGLAQLTAAARMTRPTVRRLLLALAAARLVEQDAVTRRYHLGPEAYLLGSLASPRHGMLVHAADAVRRLADETGDTAFLSVQQDDHVLCLMHQEGRFPIRTQALKTGDRNPIGLGAGGLALLAALPEAEADALFARIAPLVTRIAIADLRADVARARACGHALNPGRVVPGSWALGVAVRWPDGRPAAALSVAAIEDRMGPDRQPALVALLQREAARVEARLARHFASPERQDTA